MKKNKQTLVKEPIVCDVIKVFKTEPIDNCNRSDLRVVKWSSAKTRVLEKRRVWNLKDGTLRHRRMQGFSLEDIEFIEQNLEEIKKELKDGE